MFIRPASERKLRHESCANLHDARWHGARCTERMDTVADDLVLERAADSQTSATAKQSRAKRLLPLLLGVAVQWRCPGARRPARRWWSCATSGAGAARWG